MGVIRLGCSGWDYTDWEDVFYTDREESKLRAYSRIFNTAEINSTFYRYLEPGVIFGLSRYTPRDFRFAVKLNRLITHEKRLDLKEGVEADLKRFLELMEPLQRTGKLACILIQLSPGMKFQKDSIEDFLKILPSDVRFALEYRNETWLTEEAHNLLKDYNVAAVTVDEPLLPPEIWMTSSIAYMRWHGKGTKLWYNYRYSKDELEPWISKIKEMSQSADVYGFFNNHYHGYAPENCLQVLEMLGVATPEQRAAEQRITDYRKSKPVTKAVARTLSDFMEQEKESVSILLAGYVESSRLEKAHEIKDIELIEMGGDKIVAGVSGYSIYIDLENMLILHDCGDWRRTAREKRFCKHVAALMLSLPEDTARELLENIKRQQWEFRQYTGRGKA